MRITVPFFKLSAYSPLICALLALTLAGTVLGQNLVQYGSAAATGVTVGTAAGKKASDALTSIMGQAAGTASDQEKAEKEKAEKEKAQKERDKAKAELSKEKEQAASGRTVAANMPASAGPNQGPSAVSGVAAPARAAKQAGVSQTRESAFPREAAAVVETKPTMVATLRRKAKVVTPEPKQPAMTQVVETEEAEPIEMPITMKMDLENFHPMLQPMVERLRRVQPGASRDDVKRILGSPASKVTIPGDVDVNEIYYYIERGRTIGTVRLEAGTVIHVNTDGM